MTDAPTVRPRRWRQIPRSIWALGFVSLFMDVSSEMIHALLPTYLVTALGASTLMVGFIEGIAEATANITKVFSGALSDWMGRRKLLTVLGYGLAALTKPIFALAVVADLLLALGPLIPLTLLGAAFWGLHMGFTQRDPQVSSFGQKLVR